jgi:hypothetical protein
LRYNEKMTLPDPVNAFNGMGQGAQGFGQGGIGASVGMSQGPNLGINRAATGGPNMDQSAQPPAVNAAQPGATGQNATRKTSGFLSFLAPIAEAAASFIPGVGPLVSAGIGAIAGGIAQNNASNAANAANANVSGLAGQLATGPSLAPLIKQ